MLLKPSIAAFSEAYRSREKADFSVGDTVSVQVVVREGERERLQKFTGVVISKRNRSISSSFVVRKESYGVGVERSFPLNSPLVRSITVEKRGKVRKAKLYYLRGLSGKKSRIKERID